MMSKIDIKHCLTLILEGGRGGVLLLSNHLEYKITGGYILEFLDLILQLTRQVLYGGKYIR